MRKYTRLAIMTIALLTVGAFSASAAQASNGISSSSTGPITASGELTMNAGAVICDVSLTLELSSSTIVKRDSTQGSVTRGSITGCSGLATDGIVLAPLAVNYSSFTGTLPNIDAIQVRSPDAAFGLNTGLGVCLYEGNLTNIDFDVVGGEVAVVGFNGTRIPKASGSFLCPSSGSIAGDLTVSNPPRVALV